jgi:hypothetical protein
LGNEAEKPSQSQSDNFKEVALEYGAGEDAAHWEERLHKLAKAKPEKSK